MKAEVKRAAQAAADVRAELRKRLGYYPGARVHVRRTDYTTEVVVRLWGLNEETQTAIRKFIDGMPNSSKFCWDVY